MEEEWRIYLRENAPKLYEQMLSSVKWQAEWREKRIANLEAQLAAHPDTALLDKLERHLLSGPWNYIEIGGQVVQATHEIHHPNLRAAIAAIPEEGQDAG